MSLFEASLLGLVQGLTEFLPVSSSAHLVFVQHLLGFKKPLLFFDIMVHAGTLVSLFVYFWKDVAHLLRDSVYALFFLLRRRALKEIYEFAPYSRWAAGIIVATIPAGLAGVFLGDWFESLFGSLRTTGAALLGTSLLLWATRRFHREEKEMGDARLLDFFLIGCFQAIAITPGISRSGATIAAALFVGFKRETAFRFSFLLAIPAILGASLLQLPEGLASAGEWLVTSSGMIVAGLSGFLAIPLVGKAIRKGKLHWFAAYTLPLGILLIYLSRFLE
jgi:undecaprenyl-diphosphatase